MKSRTLRGLLICGGVLLVGGCATVRRQPVLPLPIRLVSPTPFLAHVRARADTAATYCQVLRISGTVAEVRGDTLELTSVVTDRQPRGAADCLQGRAGFVVLSSAPALQAEVGRASSGRTVALVLLLTSLSALLAFFAMLGTLG